jgi:hypothetical protein
MASSSHMVVHGGASPAGCPWAISLRSGGAVGSHISQEVLRRTGIPHPDAPPALCPHRTPAAAWLAPNLRGHFKPVGLAQQT